MGIEDYSGVESSEWWSNSAEISEKYKAAAKKARSGIKRTQKDEKKAKKYDFLLAKFLVEMILQKKYDDVLEELFSCFDAWYGSNFLIGILSLIYLPISHEIRKFAWKDTIDFHYEITGEIIDFDDHSLPPEIRKRVNAWIEDMEMVSSMEASEIITQRILWLIVYDEKIRAFTSRVFFFFFQELHISLNESKARNYSDFILSELQKTIQKNLDNDSENSDIWEEKS